MVWEPLHTTGFGEGQDFPRFLVRYTDSYRLVLFDTPGFKDTMGLVNEIVHSYYIREIIRRTFSHMVFVFRHGLFGETSGEAFRKHLKQLTKFIHWHQQDVALLNRVMILITDVPPMEGKVSVITRISGLIGQFPRDDPTRIMIEKICDIHPGGRDGEVARLALFHYPYTPGSVLHTIVAGHQTPDGQVTFTIPADAPPEPIPADAPPEMPMLRVTQLPDARIRIELDSADESTTLRISVQGWFNRATNQVTLQPVDGRLTQGSTLLTVKPIGDEGVFLEIKPEGAFQAVKRTDFDCSIQPVMRGMIRAGINAGHEPIFGDVPWSDEIKEELRTLICSAIKTVYSDYWSHIKIELRALRRIFELRQDVDELVRSIYRSLNNHFRIRTCIAAIKGGIINRYKYIEDGDGDRGIAEQQHEVPISSGENEWVNSIRVLTPEFFQDVIKELLERENIAIADFAALDTAEETTAAIDRFQSIVDRINANTTPTLLRIFGQGVGMGGVAGLAAAGLAAAAAFPIAVPAAASAAVAGGGLVLYKLLRSRAGALPVEVPVDASPSDEDSQ